MTSKKEMSERNEGKNIIDWYVEGISFGNCNCNYGCPCQFEEKPTHGNCCGFEVFEIRQGYFGDIRLDGLRAALLYSWPGPIYEGNGAMQVVIDESASPEQRDALGKILQGEETVEAATHWWVFHAMSSQVHPVLFLPIECEIDINARKARVKIGDALQSIGRPIRSPVTGDEHRVRINIPNGIEFEVAEIGSASTTSTGKIQLNLSESYGQFNLLRHSGRGVVHKQ